MAQDSLPSDTKLHWETVHENREPTAVSWYQENPALSLELIAGCDVGVESRIIDIGGGSSRLVEHLLALGHLDLSVLDISSSALAVAQASIGDGAERIAWLRGDVTRHDFEHTYGIWHDRAAFHFLTDPSDQRTYVAQMHSAVEEGGFAIIATFGLDGPGQCSGLPVQRYSPESMSAALGDRFMPVRFEREAHTTPGGDIQHFLYGCFQRA